MFAAPCGNLLCTASHKCCVPAGVAARCVQRAGAYQCRPVPEDLQGGPGQVCGTAAAGIVMQFAARRARAWLPQATCQVAGFGKGASAAVQAGDVHGACRSLLAMLDSWR